jgi:hypothetical protein
MRAKSVIVSISFFLSFFHFLSRRSPDWVPVQQQQTRRGGGGEWWWITHQMRHCYCCCCPPRTGMNVHSEGGRPSRLVSCIYTSLYLHSFSERREERDGRVTTSLLLLGRPKMTGQKKKNNNS